MYTVEVQHGKERDISEPVYIRTFSDNKRISSPSKNESSLPVVEREEISFSTKDEIGKGAFGVVFKGEWAGTEVAVKKINLRHAMRIWPVLEMEVKVHSMVRHPLAP